MAKINQAFQGMVGLSGADESSLVGRAAKARLAQLNLAAKLCFSPDHRKLSVLGPFGELNVYAIEGRDAANGPLILTTVAARTHARASPTPFAHGPPLSLSVSLVCVSRSPPLFFFMIWMGHPPPLPSLLGPLCLQVSSVPAGSAIPYHPVLNPSPDTRPAATHSSNAHLTDTSRTGASITPTDAIASTTATTTAATATTHGGGLPAGTPTSTPTSTPAATTATKPGGGASGASCGALVTMFDVEWWDDEVSLSPNARAHATCSRLGSYSREWAYEFASTPYTPLPCFSPPTTHHSHARSPHSPTFAPCGAGADSNLHQRLPDSAAAHHH